MASMTAVFVVTAETLVDVIVGATAEALTTPSTREERSRKGQPVMQSLAAETPLPAEEPGSWS